MNNLTSIPGIFYLEYLNIFLYSKIISKEKIHADDTIIIAALR